MQNAASFSKKRLAGARSIEIINADVYADVVRMVSEPQSSRWRESHEASSNQRFKITWLRKTFSLQLTVPPFAAAQSLQQLAWCGINWGGWGAKRTKKAKCGWSDVLEVHDIAANQSLFQNLRKLAEILLSFDPSNAHIDPKTLTIISKRSLRI